MSCAPSDTPLKTIATITLQRRFMWILRIPNPESLLLPARWRRGGLGRNVQPAVSLEETLVSRREEREGRVVVLVVDLDASGKTRGRVAGEDQAEQHAVDVHLVAVRRRPAADAAAVGEHRIDRR